MRIVFAILLLLPVALPAADIKRQTLISCISDKSSLQGRHKEYIARNNPEKAKSFFSEFMLGENFGDMKSKVGFVWGPKTNKGPSITIETTDKPHSLIRIRSMTKNDLIVVSSASSPFSAESWTFSFNFAVETVIATRVQSNIGGIKGEVITYNCLFEHLEPEADMADDPVS